MLHNKTVCFSGHRTVRPAAQGSLFHAGNAAGSDCGGGGFVPAGHDPALYGSLCEQLLQKIEELHLLGADTFMCGMAEGFDLMAGQAVLNMRARYRDIRLVAVVPFEGHGVKSADARAIYDCIIAGADDRVVVSPRYSHDCFHRRNDYMVERSGTLICWFNGTRGGTEYTVKAAIRRGLSIHNLIG